MSFVARVALTCKICLSYMRTLFVLLQLAPMRLVDRPTQLICIGIFMSTYKYKRHSRAICYHALGWLKNQNVSLSSGTWLLKSSYRNMPNLVNVKSYCTDAQLVLVRLYLFTDHTAICYSLCMNVWCSCIFQDTKSPQDSSINFISNIDIISHHLKVNLLQWLSIPRCLYKVHSAVCLVWG